MSDQKVKTSVDKGMSLKVSELEPARCLAEMIKLQAGGDSSGSNAKDERGGPAGRTITRQQLSEVYMGG